MAKNQNPSYNSSSLLGYQNYNPPNLHQNTQGDELALQIQSINQNIADIQLGKIKNYALEEIFPFLYDQIIPMIPFPKNGEISKFDKYKWRGDPIEHLREFFVACMDVSYNDTYLMRLFLRSLGGKAIEWFSHLPLGIKTFNENKKNC